MLIIGLLCLLGASMLLNLFQYWEIVAVVSHNKQVQDSNEQLRSALVATRTKD